MKAPLVLVLVLLGLALAFLGSRVYALQGEVDALRLALAAERGSDEKVELSVPMGALQRFADKLYFAGQRESWDLAAFYVHELEEVTESLLAPGAVADGIILAPLVEAMLLPPLATLAEAVKQRDAAAFGARYGAVVNGCNACHQATRHGFIRITVPERSMFENQSFLPLP
jgi:hypothetical protein